MGRHVTELTEARSESVARTTSDTVDVSAEQYAAGYRGAAVLHDGTKVCVRAIRADDKERLRIAFARLSSRSVYQRFLHHIAELSPGDLRYFTELDFHNHIALVLTIEEEAGERLIAVCRFVRVAPGTDRAEVAFAVADEYQHRGAGTLLLQKLIAVARGCGVREFLAQILEDNVEMLRVFQDSQRPLRQRIEDGICHVVLSIDAEHPP